MLAGFTNAKNRKLASSLSGYRDWSQVAGYFDGDGSVYVRLDSPFVLKFALIWVDNSRDQLSQLRDFLISNGISLGRVLRHSEDVYRLQVGSPQQAVAVAKNLLTSCFKKREDLAILIDYYENRITGTEAISRLNDLVQQRIRLGKFRTVPKLPVYVEGKTLSAKIRGRHAAATRMKTKLSNT